MNSSHGTEAGPPAVTRDAFLEQVSQTMRLAGDPWTFDDGETPWSVSRAAPDALAQCVDGSAFRETNSFHYQAFAYGPGSPDVAESVDRVTKGWEARGYRVRTIVPVSNGIPEIAAMTPEGTQIGFTVAAHRSSVSADSPCR